MSDQLEDEGHSELSEKIGQLKLESTDGKKYATNCAEEGGTVS